MHFSFGHAFTFWTLNVKYEYLKPHYHRQLVDCFTIKSQNTYAFVARNFNQQVNDRKILVIV